MEIDTALLRSREGHVNISWVSFIIIYLFQTASEVMDGSVTPNILNVNKREESVKY